MTPMVTKSPITMRDDKDRADDDAGARQRQRSLLHRVCQALAPLSLAASSKLRSMRIIELKIGTIMNMVNRCTKASTTEKSENSSQSTGCCDQPRSHQALVHQAVAAQQRNPGNHADHIRGPKGDGAQDKQQRLHGRAVHMECQKVGDGEANHQRERPHQTG